MPELIKIAEWIDFEYGNWKIKDNAPTEAKEIFNKFCKTYDDARENGRIVE